MEVLSGISIKSARMDITLKLEVNLKPTLTTTVLFVVRNMSDEKIKKGMRIVELMLLLIELILTAFAVYLTSMAITLVLILLNLLQLSLSSRIILIFSLFSFVLALISLLLRLIVRGYVFIEMYRKVKRNVREETSKISPEEA